MDPLDIDEKASISQKSDVEDSEVDFDVEAAERRLVRKIEWVALRGNRSNSLT